MSVTTGKKLKSVQTKKLLPEQVSDQIAKLIADRELKAGEKLPNEFEMAEQLNVGRGTIREAIKILVSKNVVEIRRGCGTFVCEHPGMIDDPLGFAFAKDQSQLAYDLYELRNIIEPEIAALAAERATPEEVAGIEQAALAVEQQIKRKKKHMEMDIAFHELIAKSTKNQVMCNITPVIQSGISLFINVTDSALAQETIRTHRLIVEGIKEKNPDKARASMSEHLNANREKILQLFKNEK